MHVLKTQHRYVKGVILGKRELFESSSLKEKPLILVLLR